MKIIGLPIVLATTYVLARCADSGSNTDLMGDVFAEEATTLDENGEDEPQANEQTNLDQVALDQVAPGQEVLPSDTEVVPGETETHSGDADGSEVAYLDSSEVDTAACVPSKETCDSIDNDCDGMVDPPDSGGCTPYFGDADGDGYGDPAVVACLCDWTPAFPAADGDDCDDANGAVHPGGSVCGFDGDCDGIPLDLNEECDDQNFVLWDDCANCFITSEFPVNVNVGGIQGYPRLAALPSGHMVAVWESMPFNLGEGNQGAYGIYARRIPPVGPPVDAETAVTAPGVASYQRFPDVAALVDGSFVVAWLAEATTDSPFVVVFQLFDALGTKTGPQTQISDLSQPEQPRIASLPDGGFVVVWAADDGWFWGVFARFYGSGGTPTGEAFRINDEVSGDQSRPSVSVSPSGQVVVVWEAGWQPGTSDNSDRSIRSRLLDKSGSKLGNEFQANSYTEGYQGEPAVATFSDGRFVVVWMSGCPKGYGLDCDENLPTQDGSNAGVFGQLFDGTGTKVGAEFQVNTFASDFQGSAQVATFGDGGFMVSWDSGCEGESGCDWGDQCQDGSFKGVYAQVFGPDGLKVGPEVQVNSYTNWSQQDSSLAVHAAGKVLVVWGSDGQAGFGSMSDIFGKWVPLPQAPTQ